MAIPHRPKGHAPIGSGGIGGTRYQESYMEDMESALPDWQLDAECSRLSPQNFAYEGEASRPLLGIGVKACSFCVVRTECLDSASPSDLYWTVRAGLFPGAMRTDAETPMTARYLADKRGDVECSRGHKGRWRYLPKKNAWRCLECDRLREEASKLGEKLEIAPLSDVCGSGHDNWRYSVDKKGNQRRECRDCQNARRRARRDRARAKLEV